MNLASLLTINGYPVSPIIAKLWKEGEKQLRNGPNGDELLLNNRAPDAGDVIKLPTLAKTMHLIAQFGKKGFYEGEVANSIVNFLESLGSVMSLEDLKNHSSTMVDPISVNYHGIDVFEIPPNSQGLTALLALNVLEEYNLKEMDPYSAKYLHIMIETMRLSFADANWFITDPE